LAVVGVDHRHVSQPGRVMAMKWNRKRSGEISSLASLSFLDIICCAFGAMVLLVLLSKTDVVGEVVDAGGLADYLADISAAQQRRDDGERARERLTERARGLEEEIKQVAAAAPDSAALQQRIDALRARAEALKAQAAAVPTPAEAAPNATTDEVVKVGGIPVDSEHVIFIVDTSGSMQAIWERVIAELENVLDIHPQVEGFQIMNDNGAYLISAYAGRWIPDTPGRRRSVLNAMRAWRSVSNSSPVEGLQKALRTYAKRTDKLAIYIFGDDYSGGSYDEVLDAVVALNHDRAGRPRARIHGIGFHQQNGVANKFATLMREVARQNRGAFIALGLEERSSIVEATRPNRN